eukprot:2924331-Prorocentrum_lima.AAC.1
MAEKATADRIPKDAPPSTVSMWQRLLCVENTLSSVLLTSTLGTAKAYGEYGQSSAKLTVLRHSIGELEK